MFFSHVKISPLLWLHNKLRFLQEKTVSVKWCGITLVFIIIIIIITLFESQIILAEHECCTNWGDCKSNKSNQIKSNVGF